MTSSTVSADQGSEPASFDAIVLGAGLSGLIVAVLLERAGLAVAVVESRERLGGRIAGIASTTGPHRHDLGPAWLWPAVNDRLAHWLRELDLPVFEQHSRGAVLVESSSGAMRRHVTGFVQDPPSMRVVGGTMRLVDALRARLVRSRVLTAAQAVSLQLAPGGIRVDLQTGNRPLSLTAASLVVAMPPRLAAALDWHPALPDRLVHGWAASPTWMAGQAKVVAIYRTAFWRERGLSGTAISQAGPLAEMHDASDAAGEQPALFGFVGIAADDRRRIDAAAMTRAALQQFARLFGREALEPVHVQWHDWATEAGTATPADIAHPGGHPEPLSTAMPPPWAGVVHLAGSEFAPVNPGYLEGAVRAAERAAAALLSAREGALGGVRVPTDRR